MVESAGSCEANWGFPTIENERESSLVRCALPSAGISVLALLAGLLSWLQFQSPHLAGVDVYHHLRVASLVREGGPLTEFPWWRYSIYRDHYADKEPLYHIILAAFTFGDLEIGGKIAAVAFALLVFGCFHRTCVGLRVPWAAAWGLVLLASGPMFLFRVSLCRPHVPGIALFLAVLYCALRGRWIWLLVLSCVFSLMHSTAPLGLVLAITCEVCRRLVGGRFNWRVVVATAAGLAIGTLVHPNFPENLTVQAIQAWQIPRSFLASTPVRLGGELYPYSTKQLLLRAPLGLFCLVAACLAMAHRDRRVGHDSLTLLCVCVITLTMTALSRRFLELFCPVAVLFLATLVRDAAPGQWPARRQTVSLFLSALVLMGGALHSIREARKIMPNPTVPAYREAAEWIRENVPPGECVFTAGWDDYPLLFFFDTDHVYLVGLDPTFMYAWDAEVYAEWDRLRHARSEQPFREIVKQFDSRIVVATKDFPRLINAARSNPQVLIPVENNHLVVLDLRQLSEIPTTRPAQP